jgi:hypothetical protein
VCETHKDLERMIVIASVKNMKRAAKIAADHGVVARMSFDAIHPPVGTPSIFDAPKEEQEEFAFAKAPELDANDIDFDKLIARERAIRKSVEDAEAAA